MDEEIETLVVGVRADTQAFARDVGAMRGTLEGGIGDVADRAGRALERGLLSALQKGRFGFEDLRKVALNVMSEIAAAALQSGLGGQGGGGSGASGLTGLFAGLLGAPGRATGGPVSPVRAFMVGERGPDLFVPTSSGRIEAAVAPASPAIRLTINVAATGSSPAQAIERSSRQVARAVGRAIQNAKA